MKKYVVLNWKANPDTLVNASKLLGEYLKLDYKKVDLVVCSPTPFLFALKNKKIKLGAQDVSSFDGGAHTGEVTASALKSVGVKYCIVGHSERRRMGETTEEIVKKIKLLTKNNIIPILCIGERERGLNGEHFTEISDMLTESIKDLPKKSLTNIIVAYEPIWAISTENNGAITSEVLSETIIYIKKILSDIVGRKIASNIKIIYGGSVDEKIVKELSSTESLDGFLVGKAGLKSNSVKKIFENI